MSNQKFNLTIQTLGKNGEGVGNFQGRPVYVDNALPGEFIEGQFTQKNRTFGRAHVTNLLTPSPDRVTPPCSIFGKCGGCQIMHLSYPQQLIFKRQKLIQAFEQYETLKTLFIEPCLPSPRQLMYRNKIQLPVRSTEEGFKIGLYARNSHDIVAVDHCSVHCELGEEVFQKIRSLIESHAIASLLRFLLIKTAVNTKEVLVTFVVCDPVPEKMYTIANEILSSIPEVKGVILNQNSSDNNVILGETFTCLAGTSFIHEKLNDLLFKISSASFFQVNPYQAEVLYQKAIELAGLSFHDTIIDLYCGVGTLTLHAGRKAKHVIGIECVPEAIQDAIENAELNDIKNVKFICDLSEKALLNLDHVDVVFLNPPRKGCEKAVLDALMQIKPRTIIYISCDPETLARDLNTLTQSYVISHIQPLDMFPQTAHVETIARLDLSPKL